MVVMNQPSGSAGLEVRRRGFATTHWSLILAAAEGAPADSRNALAALCRTYWYPLYAYLRSHGHGQHDAEDLTQEFFATLLEKGHLQAADRRRGRFRSFLLTAFKRFLAKEQERARARKRGGGKTVLSLDFPSGEERYQCEPSHDWTAERLFDRRWALTLLDQVVARLGSQFTASGKGRLWEQLHPYLIGTAAAPPLATVAGALGMTERAVKVAVHRLRQRYRELLRDDVAQTVAHPEDIDDELTVLLTALRGGSF
jgi:RNA polymerase sigma factor (sigma-70 family)